MLNIEFQQIMKYPFISGNIFDIFGIFLVNIS